MATERIVNLRIERLPEGAYLATSDEVQSLVAQGRTIAETVETARDVARKLVEAEAELATAPDLRRPDDDFMLLVVIVV
jgi:predicted RNase H-like HicB family nuclease